MAIFISCDWGTSSLRLRLVESGMQSILDEIKTNEGIASVHQRWKQEKTANRFEFYCSVLNNHIFNWEKEYGDAVKNAPLLISGMASSSIGITELPYTSFPYAADGADLLVRSFPAVNAFAHTMHIVSGARTQNDAMRGEETLLAGCEINDGLFIFPGTHSKHIKVENGIAVDLATFMTGEFFELLSRQSVLAGSVQANEDDHPAFFTKGILEGSAGNILNSAFGVRVNQLFKKAGAAENYQYLSGLLIGAELNTLAAGDPCPVTIVAEKNLLEKYLKGLAILQPHRPFHSVDAGKALLNGHFKIFSKLHHA